jgi:hypothetical protein
MPRKRAKKNARSRAKNKRTSREQIHLRNSPKNETKGFRQVAKGFAKVAGIMIGATGLGLFLAIRAAAPQIHIDYFDAGDPFRFPFVAVNNSFITFYDLQSDFAFYIPDTVPALINGLPGEAAELVAEEWGEPSVVDIPPSARRDFYATALGELPTLRPQYKHLEVSIAFAYEVLPIIRWHREMRLGYKMVIASDDTRHWVEDDTVIKDVPNVRRGERPPRPKD